MLPHRLPALLGAAGAIAWLARRASLEAANALARDIGLPGEIWRIRAALADVADQRGDAAQARQAFVQAAASIQSLANQIDGQRLRIAFLTAESVWWVLDAAQ